MTRKPEFSCFLANEKYSIRPGGPKWRSALPINRTPLEPESAVRPLTYGDYFEAVRVFLERDQYKAVVTALYCVGRGNGDIEQIQAIRVFLVKHGQYYHPARIEINCGKLSSFVLNVAVSATAREMIKKEATALDLLCTRFPYFFLPKVYARGEVCIDGGRDFGMFLGQWFEGYHEFHLSRGNGDGNSRIIVWDGRPAKHFLSPEQTGEVYTRAALILTAYYNPATFERITAWHHAAGDFVIRPDRGRIIMKLITVRQYAPLFENAQPDVHLMLEALQFFLLDLSLHMGLDRLDGVGDPTWAGDRAVAGSVDGFFKGLMLQVKVGLIPREIVEGCREYLAAVSRAEWIDMIVSVVNRYDASLPDLPLIRFNLDQYAACLYRSVTDMDRHTI